MPPKLTGPKRAAPPNRPADCAVDPSGSTAPAPLPPPAEAEALLGPSLHHERLPKVSRVRLLAPAGAGATATVWRGVLEQDGRPVAVKIAHDLSAGAVLATEALQLLLAASPHLPELITLGWLPSPAPAGAATAEAGAPGAATAKTGTAVNDWVLVTGHRPGPGPGAVRDGAAADATAADATAPTAPEATFRPAMVTSWIEGTPVDATPRDEAADLAAALRVAADVGAALADLHAAGIAHGDIKPANIIVGPAGRACLIDLGLAAPLGDVAPRGGTPRYLARGDDALGDGRARDLLALGVVVAELAVAAVRAADDPLAAARSLPLPPPLDQLCAALLAREPGARPSARWVRDWAEDWTDVASPASASAGPREVRAHYLRLRQSELWTDADVPDDVAPWLARAVDVARRAHQMGARPPTSAVPRPPAHGPLEPLDPEGRIRWIAALVGSPAVAWGSPALGRPPEPVLASRLCELAARKRPTLWTLRDVDRAARAGDPDDGAGPAPESGPPGQPPGTERGSGHPDDASSLERVPPHLTALTAQQAAELALRISRVPLDAQAIAVVERMASHAPLALRLATADGLRLAGELGRARALVRGLHEAGAIAADILRRAGDRGEALAVAQLCVRSGEDPDGRARACWARLCLDAGDVEQAATLTEHASTAPVAEVSALVYAARGEPALARQAAEQSLALASSAEERARAWATLAYVCAASEPTEALEGYRAAVSHAVQAGAVLEEATYRTSEAALSVDLGHVEHAITAAARAAVLWEQVLGRPSMAARAYLARAAAYASVGAVHEATQASLLAVARAQAGQDHRAAAYAWWAIADACAPDQPQGADAARKAYALVLEMRTAATTAPQISSDRVQAAARLLLHAPDELDGELLREVDRDAGTGSSLEPHARLAWWGSRAWQMARTPATHGRAVALGALQLLATLVDEPAPAAARARAMLAGRALATALGEPVLARQLELGRERAAAALRAGCRHSLAAAAARCSWIAPADAGMLDWAQALDLQRLVRALGERGSLRALLTQVLDVMLQWTGAERGLLLLHDEQGALVPRAARNLQREDLVAEQLAVSRSLAERAIALGAPVVAVDAMDELGDSFASVHALRLRSVLVAPLAARGEVLGVVYLDDRVRRGAFGPREVSWAESVAPVAALAISDAAAQAKLRRRVRRAERSSAELERELAQKRTALEVAERELAQVVGSRTTRFDYDEIVGQSEPIQAMLRLVDRIAVAEVPVLLRGESGSGKELVARAIHQHSGRSAGAFVSENCAAVPEALLESALFGHVRGAFTTAVHSRVGLFEAADGGTLFLDEIGEMTPAMQTRLLRVLEDGQLRPVGSERVRKVDVRVIAATHRDLETMVAQGEFREDLYYRLDVVSVTVPPLRERPDDVPLLVRHFLEVHSVRRRRQEGAPPPRITPDAMAALSAYEWPGNVRQLENEIRRAVLLCDGEIGTAELSVPIRAALTAAADAALRPGPAQSDGLRVRARVDQLEAELVRQALTTTRGNQTRAAKLLGISRYGLHKMMRRLGMTTRAAR